MQSQKTGSPHGNTPSSTLRVLITNAFGLQSKFGEFRHRITHNNIDIAIVTETKFTHEKVPLVDTLIPGYSAPLRLDRTAHGGGVCVWVKSSIVVAQLHNSSVREHEIIWFKVRTHSEANFLLAAVYRPGTCSEQDVSLMESIEESLAQLREPNTSIILAGDFNVHSEEWLGSTKTTKAGEYLEDLCTSHGLSQHVTQPTRGSNILDLLMSDWSSQVSVEISDPIGRSDHNVVIADFMNAVPIRQERSVRTVWRYHQADWGRLRHYFKHHDWQKVITDDPVKTCEHLTATILDGMSKYIPSRKLVSTPSDPVWWSPECNDAVLAKEKEWRRWRKRPSDQCLKSNYVSAVQHCVHVLNQSRALHEQRLRQKLSTGGLRDKEWWTTIKRIGGNSRESEIPVLIENGVEMVSAREKADCFGLHFSRKCNLGLQDLSPDSAPEMKARNAPGLHTIHFRPASVKRLLSRLDTSKATGPDGVPGRVVKECSAELCLPVTQLFQLISTTGVQPPAWKCAQVVPIHKRNSKSNVKNYRPVSLLPILSKIFESVVNNQLVNYLEKHQLLSSNQYGFRRGLGTSDLLTVLHNQWVNIVGRGGSVRALAVDIAGAFDRVSHPGLICKLRHYGIQGGLLTWFKSYLRDRKLCAVVDGQTSSQFPLAAGVPQGSILGPTLFLLYINDLEDHLPQGVDLAVYADDTTLYVGMSGLEDMGPANDILQLAVNAVFTWGQNWRITFEPSKSQSLVLTTKRSPLNLPAISFGGTDIPEVQQLHLLGIRFDTKLSFRAHLRQVAARGNQRLSFLRRAARVLNASGRAVVYKGFVRPVLEYGPLVWMGAAESHLNQLDRVQHRALRIIGTGTVLPSLRIRRAVAGLSYLYKLQCLSKPQRLKDIVPPQASIILNTRTRSQMVRRHPYQLDANLPVSSPDLLRRSFPYGLLAAWNSLPDYILNVPPERKKLHAFKVAVNKHLTRRNWLWATDYRG